MSDSPDQLPSEELARLVIRQALSARRPDAPPLAAETSTGNGGENVGQRILAREGDTVEAICKRLSARRLAEETAASEKQKASGRIQTEPCREAPKDQKELPIAPVPVSGSNEADQRERERGLLDLAALRAKYREFLPQLPSS